MSTLAGRGGGRAPANAHLGASTALIQRVSSKHLPLLLRPAGRTDPALPAVFGMGSEQLPGRADTEEGSPAREWGAGWQNLSAH